MALQDAFDSPDLAPDLEWMLQSTTIGDEAIVRKMIEEFYPSIYCLAKAILGDHLLAQQAAGQTFIEILLNRDRYQDGKVLNAWIYKHALETIHKLRKRTRKDRFRLNRSQEGGHRKVDLLHTPVGGTTQLGGTFLLRDYLDGLPEIDLLILLLTVRLGVEANLVAEILKTTPGSIHNCVEAASDRFRDLNLPEDPDHISGMDRLEEGFCVLFQLPYLSENQKELLTISIVRQIGERQKHLRLVHSLTEIFLVGVIILVGFGLGWVVNIQGTSESPIPPVRTIIVTQIVESYYYVEVTPTPGVENTPFLVAPDSETDTRSITPEPLAYDTDPRAVLAAIRKSYTFWNALSLDARITFFGPQGLEGYPLTYRVEIDQDKNEGNFLVVSGAIQSFPDEAILIQRNQFYHLTDLGIANNVPFQEIQGKKPMLGEYLYKLILFPYTVFQNMPFYNHISGKNTLAGRDVIILDQFRSNRKLLAQIWVDRVTGFPLKQIIYSQIDPEQVLQEVQITSISLDPILPQYLFKRDFSWHKSFIQEDQSDILTGLVIEVAPKIIPPLGFDLQSARLNFQFYEQWTMSAGSITSINNVADIFGDGYFLGTWEMSDPLDLICVRSPDGTKIATVEWVGDFGREIPYWFDLRFPEITHPIRSISATELEFAPDSRRLAILDTYPGTAVYIYDTESDILRKLKTLNGARSFVWSPDGRYLAMIALEYSFSRQEAVLVLDVSTGEVVYTQLLNEENGGSEKDEWPMVQWGVEFPVDPILGLEGCSEGN